MSAGISSPFLSRLTPTRFPPSAPGHPELILPTIQDKLVRVVLANYMLWPMAHIINFKFVPSQHRVLFNNVVSVSALDDGAGEGGDDANWVPSAEAPSQCSSLRGLPPLPDLRLLAGIPHLKTHTHTHPSPRSTDRVEHLPLLLLR